MKKEASNALLKLIEEPNRGCFFILLNSNLNILPTIKSRSILVKIKRRTAEELGVDDFTYSFFRGESEDIKNFKALNLSLETGYSFLEIGKAVKAYDENRDLKDKINIYKALRDFINNKNYLKIHEKIYFAGTRHVPVCTGTWCRGAEEKYRCQYLRPCGRPRHA